MAFLTENENDSVYDDPFKMIRNNFNFAYICEFLHKFSSAFFNGSDDPLPTTPFMEHLLLYQDDASKINQFYMKILKPLPGWRLISQDNWLESLGKEYKKRDLELDITSPTTISTILTIPLLQRLEILRNLCDFHLEQPDHFWELLRVNDAESEWRLEPIGRDSDNRRYWLFSDARMYRETESAKESKTEKKDKKRASSRAAASTKSAVKDAPIPWDFEDESNWELVCLTRADYDEFLENFANTNNKPVDKAFVKYVREEIIPEVEPVLNYQLSQHKKYFRPQPSERICLLPRKRSSRLLEKEIEDEKRRLAEHEQEKERQAMRRVLLAERTTLVPPPPSREQIEKDLVAERELRAESRRMKKEKELQIKAIEEAFYSSYDPNNVEGNQASESETEDIDIVNEEGQEMMPKSPIKLVLKISRPFEAEIIQPPPNVLEEESKVISHDAMEDEIIVDDKPNFEPVKEMSVVGEVLVEDKSIEDVMPDIIVHHREVGLDEVISDEFDDEKIKVADEVKTEVKEEEIVKESKSYLDLLSDAIEKDSFTQN